MSFIDKKITLTVGFNALVSDRPELRASIDNAKLQAALAHILDDYTDGRWQFSVELLREGLERVIETAVKCALGLPTHKGSAQVPIGMNIEEPTID